MPEMDQCLRLGCCIRPFDEVTTTKRQLVGEEAETLQTPRPESRQPTNQQALTKGGILLVDSDDVKPERNRFND